MHGLRVVTACLAGLFALCLTALPAAAQSADDQAAIIAVIEDQMSAFRADDGPRAFSHAAPGIQTMFGGPDNFMNMVRRGYQQVYRPSAVEFRDLTADGATLVQRVYVIGPDGKAAIARYFMQQQPDGAWKISGVVMEAIEDFSA